MLLIQNTLKDKVHFHPTQNQPFIAHLVMSDVSVKHSQSAQSGVHTELVLSVNNAPNLGINAAYNGVMSQPILCSISSATKGSLIKQWKVDICRALENAS